MAIKQLTEEQVRTMTLEEKDTWWKQNIWRGDMPQLTLRTAITGALIGGLLSLTNLYINIKTGWSLGVGITSVIISFVMWKLFSRLNIGKPMTILENNAMQSIAVAAGYMTTPMSVSLAAYMMITQKVIPMYQMITWMIPVAILGVLYAFPLKKRFINDEQLAFPEGKACGIVLDGLHNPDDSPGHSKIKLLLGFGIFGAVWNLLRSVKIMSLLKIPFSLPEYVDDWIYKFMSTPTILGTPITSLTLRMETDIVMVAAGGLMGIKAAFSLMLGSLINFAILAPIMINRGVILPSESGVIGFRQITTWSLWGGVAFMTIASLTAFFSKPQSIIQGFCSIFKSRKSCKVDILKDIELPTKVFVIGIPIVSFITIALTHYYFGLNWWMGIIVIPLTFLLTIIAVHSTGLTSTTPVGALGKITQLTYAGISPGNITSNIMTAAITAETVNNASNLLMDIKPGYMLGAKPRQQAIGHVIGIIAGSLCAVPVFYLMFHGDLSLLGSEQMPMPSALVWRGVAEVLTKGINFLHPTARYAMLIGGVLGILFEVVNKISKGKFPLSAVAMGLGFVIPFATCFSMFLGAFIFWFAGLVVKSQKSWVNRVMLPAQETICAGVIAGGALIGILIMLIELKF